MPGATQQAVFSEVVSDGTADFELVSHTPYEIFQPPLKPGEQYKQGDPKPGDLIDPEPIQLWRKKNQKYLAMALEPVDYDATASQPKFGAQNVKFEVPRQPHFMWHTYAKLSLPGLVGIYKDADGNTKVLKKELQPHWHDSIGFRAITSATLAVGGIQVMQTDARFNWIENKVEVSEGQQPGRAIGHFDTLTELQRWSRHPQTCHTLLPFPCSKDPGNAFPLCALGKHKIVVLLSFADRHKCYKLPEGVPKGVQVCARLEGVTDDDIESGKVVPEVLTNDHLTCVMESTMVYVDEEEIDLFKNNAFDQAITEVQRVDGQASYHNFSTRQQSDAVGVKIETVCKFASLVREYFIVVHTQENDDKNDYFNFGGFVAGKEDDEPYVMDPFRTLTLKFQNAERVGKRNAQYYSHQVGRVMHASGKNCEKYFIYNWSYAQDPNTIQFNGGANHSRIDDISWVGELDPRLFTPESSTVTMYVYARCANILRIDKGNLLRCFT